MNINIKKLHEDAITPTYGSDGAACFDLYALEPAVVRDGYSAVLRTGLAFEIPQGYVMELYSRSGTAFKNGVRLATCVSIIDSDFRGELMIKLQSDYPPVPTRDIRFGETTDNSYIIKKGDRIAQAKITKYTPNTFTVVDELSETNRGTGGLGSTGK